MSQTLPAEISPSIKASITPSLTKLIDAITDGTGTGDLVEYVLLLVDSIKEKKDFADDIAAFFGEEPAQQLTDELFALILKETSTSSVQSSVPSSHDSTHDSIHDSIPPLESVSTFPIAPPSFVVSPPSSSLTAVTQSAQTSQPESAHVRALLPQPTGSRIVKLSSSSSTTSSKQMNVQSRDNKVSSRIDSRSRSPQPQSYSSQPVSHTATKQISLKRGRDDETSEQPARKSITLKRDANNETSGKSRLTIRKRPHDQPIAEQESHKRQIHIAKQPSSAVLSSLDHASAEHGHADMEDDSTGPDYVPILTDVNAPFQPQQLQSRFQNNATKPPNGRKHRLTVPDTSELADELPVPAAATTTRCLFFPSCSKGDACPFFHPPPCTYFPKCRQGDKCPNYHPPCKFAAACTNALCTYSHPANRVAPGAHTIPAGANPCRFGDQCTRSDCYYTHPRDKQTKDKQTKGPRDGICAFDPNCTSIGCSFQHPQREAADRAWMSS